MSQVTADAQQEVAFDGRTYTLDAFGFLEPPDQWDETFAEGMARLQGIYGGLGERHWEVIRYLRRKLKEEGSVPFVVMACLDCNLRLGELRELFPAGYQRGACRIAGLNYAFIYRTNFWVTCETRPLPRHRVSALGFLEESERWDEGFAQAIIVGEWGLPELTDRHREVIAFLREHYRRHGTIPTVHEACRGTRMGLAELHDLFPEGYRRGACRAAGLPLV